MVYGSAVTHFNDQDTTYDISRWKLQSFRPKFVCRLERRVKKIWIVIFYMLKLNCVNKLQWKYTNIGNSYQF
jgi:hypothetical protein